MFRKRLLGVLSAAMLIAAPTAAYAQAPEDPTTAEASAEAVALNVGDVVVISHSSAGNGSASATVLEIGGETVVGGSQDEEGTSEGEIVTTGETPLGELTIGGYAATVTENGSNSNADVLHVVFGDESTGTLTVLHSDASTGPDGSSASSDGAELNLGDGQLVLTVLHAESNSDGSTSYLVAINDQQIGSDEDFDGQACPIDASPVAAVTLVCADADDGAIVGEADLGDDSFVATAFSSDQQDAEVAEEEVDDAEPETDDENPTMTDEIPSLPRTGGPLALSALAGFASLGAGTWLRRRSS